MRLLGMLFISHG